MPPETNVHNRDNEESGRSVRIPSFLKNNKIESLTVLSYGISKAVVWSAPTICDVILAFVLITIIKVTKIIWKSGVGTILRIWLHNLDVVLTRIFKDTLCPLVEPHEFIQWITAGRFTANIACKEKKPFDNTNVSKCRRKFCRFSFQKKVLPTMILKMIPYFRKFLKPVYISEYIRTKNRGALDEPGDLIEWSALGIKFQIESDHWVQIVQNYRAGTIDLTAEIAHFWGKKRIRIEARKVGVDYNMALIYGEFHKDHKFNPRKIQPHKKGMLSIPICSARQAQCNPTSKQIYTPIHPIP